MLQGRYLDLFFTTATVRGWKHLLRPDKYKCIITDSWNHLVNEGSVSIYAFVIMPNHLHWIWQMRGESELPRIQQRMLKFVAQQIKFDLIQHHPNVLDLFKVGRKDRSYQFFKERPLSIPLYTDKIVIQKMDYLHRNPTQEKWRLAASPEDYLYSSAAFYALKDQMWPFLTHFWYGENWFRKEV